MAIETRKINYTADVINSRLDAVGDENSGIVKELAEITPKINKLERKIGVDIVHEITAEEAAEWNEWWGTEHYAAGDGLIEIYYDTPVRYLTWSSTIHKLHVEQYSICHNEITIYVNKTSTLCIDDFDKIGDIIPPSEDKMVAYSILDGIIVCGEVTLASID